MVTYCVLCSLYLYILVNLFCHLENINFYASTWHEYIIPRVTMVHVTHIWHIPVQSAILTIIGCTIIIITI